MLRSDLLRAGKLLRNVEHQDPGVVRTAAPFQAVGQNGGGKLARLASFPTGEQILQPFVVQTIPAESLMCVASGGGEPSCNPAGRHEQVTRRTLPPRFK